MASRKQAPRREVTDVERVGDWGEVLYHHRLSCGHVEVRKRPSPSGVMSCMFCLHERERPASKRVEVEFVEFDGVEFDAFATSESAAVSLQAGVAVRFGVPIDSVRVHMNALGKPLFVTVSLTLGEATRRL